jgi:hypothetical protein
VSAQLLQEQAERCTKHASECKNPKAERVLRLLALDLIIAARMQGARTEPAERAGPHDRLKNLARLIEQNREARAVLSNELKTSDVVS